MIYEALSNCACVTYCFDADEFMRTRRNLRETVPEHSSLVYPGLEYGKSSNYKTPRLITQTVCHLENRLIFILLFNLCDNLQDTF